MQATWPYSEPLSDGNTGDDVISIDRTTGIYRRLSVSNSHADVANMILGDMSADGQTVVMTGPDHANLADTNGFTDVLAESLAAPFGGTSGTGSITGTVTDGSQPISGVLVRAISGTRRVALAYTAANGTYTIGGLPAGSYVVRADDPSNLHEGRYSPSGILGSDAVAAVVPSGGSTEADVVLPAAPPTPTVNGSATLLAADSNGVQPAVSANGRWVVYTSTGGLVKEIDRAGIMPTRPLIGLSSGTSLAVSDDGSEVAFLSTDSGLVPGDTNGVADLFVENISAGWVKRLSLGRQWRRR